MATLKEIKELALHAAKRTAPANYSLETVDEALRSELQAIAGSLNEFRRNRYDIYDIIIETADEIVPSKVIQAMSAFAEIQIVPQGSKAKFKTSVGKQRAKKFLTQVGLSGVYETFRLDKDTFDVSTYAVGGGATLDFERLLDGAESMADVMEILTEGLADAIYIQVQRALVAAVTNMAAPNKVIANNFSAASMVSLINTVKAYGNGAATIFAPPEFIAAMGPDAIVPAIASAAQGIYSPDDIESIHRLGRIQIFRGTPIVEIPQSFVDTDNVHTWINPQFAYVFPSGQEKVVKIALEGQTQIWDTENKDQSMEIYAYRKMGAAILTYHNWGVYKNTGITDNSYNPYSY